MINKLIDCLIYIMFTNFNKLIKILFQFVFLATSYRVSVKTGDVRGAGTDANAYIKIFGSEGDTGKISLKQSENTKNKFERGRVDQFTVEAMDIGEVSVEFC